MALDLADYERKARDAVMAFWGNREKARQKQIEAGKLDQGERAGVTGGKNMDGFVALVKDIVHANGLTHADIYCGRRFAKVRSASRRSPSLAGSCFWRIAQNPARR